jgi:hypothetical protein
VGGGVELAADTAVRGQASSADPAQRADRVVRLELADPAGALGTLLPAVGEQLQRLELHRPTLEDVFFARTGRGLEPGTDAGGGEGES